MNLLLVVAVTAMGCRIQAVDMVWDTSEWKPILTPCPTCRDEKTIDGRIVARSPQGSFVAGGGSTSTTSIQKASVITVKSSRSGRRKPGLVPNSRTQPQSVSSPGSVQLVYLPEGSLEQLTSAKAARIVSNQTPRQQRGNFVEVSPSVLPELVQNVGFSDKQKRDQSGRIVGGGVSNALPVSILTTPGQEQDAKEKLRLLEAALTAPSETTPKEDGRLPRVFIAPSHVPPPPGYIKIPLVPHGEPDVSTVAGKEGALPQTFLTSDKSSPPPGFIKFDLPEDVSHLSRDIPVVVPNNLPPESSSGFTQALDVLGVNRQPRTSKSQRPAIQTIQQQNPKLSTTRTLLRPEQQGVPRLLFPPRGQTRLPPSPGQAPDFLQFNQPRPNQAVRPPTQTKQPFPERPQFSQVSSPPLKPLRPGQSFPPPDQTLPRPGSSLRLDTSSLGSEKPLFPIDQSQRQPGRLLPPHNQPFSQTGRPLSSKEPAPQINQLIPQSGQRTEPQKPSPQPVRPIPQSGHSFPQVGQSFLHFGQPFRRPTSPFPQLDQSPSQPRPPFPQPDQLSPQPGQPSSQSSQLSPQHDQSSPQPGKPSPQHDQPTSQHDQPTSQHDQPSPQHDQPSPQPGQPSPQHDQPTSQPGQPSPQPGRSSPHPGRSSPQPGQFSPQPGQPSPQLGQPSPQPRQPSLQPGQFSPQHDQLSPQPSPTFPQTGSPFQPGRPFPQPRQPPSQPRQPTPQPRQPPPQPRKPTPQPRQPPPHPRKSTPQPHQPSPQPGQTFPQPRQPLPQLGQTFPQLRQPSPQPGQPFPQPGQPIPQPGQPFPLLGQPFPQPDQPFPQPSQPFPQPGQPFPQPNQPFPQPSQPFSQPSHPPQPPSQPPPKPDQPFPKPGQPFPQPGQPFSQPGQPFSQPSQPPKSPSQQPPKPGQPFPQPGQPFSQPSQPPKPPSQQPPKPGQPFTQPGKLFLQPDQPFPQPNHPLQPPNQPPSKPDQSFPQPNQPLQPPNQPPSKPDQSFPQSSQPLQTPSQPLPQPGQPFPLPNQPFPQSGRPFPQPGQPNRFPPPSSHPGQHSSQSNHPSPPPSNQGGQLFPQFSPSFSQSGSSVPHFGSSRLPQPLSTSPSPPTTLSLNLESSPTSEARLPSTLQDTPRPSFTSPSTSSSSFTPQPTPSPSFTPQPTPSPSFTPHSTQKLSSTFQPPTSPRFTSQSTQRHSSTPRPTPRPSFTQRQSSTFQPPTSPRFTSQSTQRPDSTFQPTPSPSFTSPSTTQRTIPALRNTPRSSFTSRFTPRPSFSPSPFTIQNEQSSSEPNLIPQSSPSTTPSPAFPPSIGPFKPASPASQSPIISVPGAVSQSSPKSSFSPGSFSTTLRPQPVSTTKFSKPPAPSQRPFVSSTLRPQPVTITGFPRPFLTSTPQPQPISFTSHPLNLPTFAPFGIDKRPSSRQPETEKKPRQRPRSRIPSFRKPQKPSTSQPQSRPSPDFAPFRPPALTSTGVEEQTRPFQPEVTTEGFLSTVSSTRSTTTTTTTTPRVTTFKPRFNFSIANRRPFLRRKQRPSSALNKDNDGAAKKEIDTSLKKEGGEKKTETATLFPPFAVARTLNPLRTQKESTGGEASGGVRVPPAGVFGRRLKPRTRRPSNRFRTVDSVTASDVADEVTPGTVAPTKVRSQNGSRVRTPTGLRGRELPDWLKARRRNRARGRSRGTEASRKTEKEQVEDAPLDVLENNGFNAAESTVVEFSRPPENKVTQPLNPHEALKLLAEDATDAANEGISELLDAASRTVAEHVSKGGEDSGTDTIDGVDIPREHTGDFTEASTFHGNPSEDGGQVAADTEYTEDTHVVVEPEAEPEPEPEPEPQAETFDDAATTQPELQHPPQYVSEDDLQDKPETPLPPYRLSKLSSSLLTNFGLQGTAPTPSPAPQNLPRPQPKFSDYSAVNLDDGGSRIQVKENQREVLSPEDSTDTSNSDHNDRTTVAMIITSNRSEGDGLPNDHFTTLSPGESQDYYVYEYEELYDDPAEQSADQNFGGSRAQVVFAVPVTEYSYNAEDALTTTPAAEVVVELSETLLADSKETTLDNSSVTTEVPQAVTEGPQVATNASKNTSNVLHIITNVPQVTEEVFQVTTEVSHVTEEVPQVTEEVPQVTEEMPQVTEEVPQSTTEDTVPETTTESLVSSETDLVTGASTTERDVKEQQPHAATTPFPSSTLRPAKPLITFIPFPFTSTTTDSTTTTATTTSRPRPVSIRPLHARLLGARKKKLSSGSSSIKKDSSALKIVGKSTVAEIQSSDPVVCFPGHPCVRAVGVGRLLSP